MRICGDQDQVTLASLSHDQKDNKTSHFKSQPSPEDYLRLEFE